MTKSEWNFRHKFKKVKEIIFEWWLLPIIESSIENSPIVSTESYKYNNELIRAILKKILLNKDTKILVKDKQKPL